MPTKEKSRSHRMAEHLREQRGDDGGWTDGELSRLYDQFNLGHPGGNTMHSDSKGWAWLVRRDDGKSYLTSDGIDYLDRHDNGDRQDSDGRQEARAAALREFEQACNVIALLFDHDSPQRHIALQARGDMREALGEGRS